MLVGFVFWYRGLALGGIASVGQLQLLQPFLGLALAGLLLHEQVALDDDRGDGARRHLRRLRPQVRLIAPGRRALLEPAEQGLVRPGRGEAAAGKAVDHKGGISIALK